jgi:predicted transcriptional regulator
MDQSTFAFLVVMVIFGTLGGFIGYLLSGGNGTESKTGETFTLNWHQASMYMVTGIGASLLVPLLLNTISSDLMKSVPGDGIKMLVFGGFCLLAAISSKTFIASISKKILAEIDKVRVETASAVDKAEILAEKVTEADEEQLLGDTVKFYGMKAEDPDQIKILKALANGSYVYRSLSGISKEINLGKERISQVLNELVNENYAEKANREKGVRWFITPDGRDFLYKQIKS